MVTIMICSDLHTNFHKDGGRSVIKSLSDADIAVVAGDLTTQLYLKDNIKQLCDKYNDVIYVTGNHEYYHSTFNSIEDEIRHLESIYPNLTWLNNTRATIGGVEFIGATLWFKKTVAAQINKHGLNDFRCIPDCDPVVFDRYDEAEEYLTNNIREGDVVITHHLPSYQSVSSKFTGSVFNCFFANRLDGMIAKAKPAIWIHGHTHDSCDYQLHSTRVCCNPFGYPGENPFFNDSYTIEV